MDYVQVPIDDDSLNNSSKEDKPKATMTASRNTNNSSESSQRPTALHNRLVKQINVSSDSSSGFLVKSGSESSLSEDTNTAADTISTKEWQREKQNEKDVCSDNEEASAPIPSSSAVIRRRRSRVNTVFRKSEGIHSFIHSFIVTSRTV